MAARRWIYYLLSANNNVRTRSDLGVTVMWITVLPTRVKIARLTNAVMRAMGGTVKATTTRGMRLVYQE